MPSPLTASALKRGGAYNWINQPERLIYVGRQGPWHQFSKIGDPRDVWCEVLTEDLHMLEETQHPQMPDGNTFQAVPPIDRAAIEVTR